MDATPSLNKHGVMVSSGLQNKYRMLEKPPGFIEAWPDERLLGVTSVYWSTWAKDGKMLYVALGRESANLYGQGYRVRIYSRRGTVVGTGRVVLEEEDVPYCLLEVRTGHRALPEEHRSRWVLALGSLPLDASIKDVSQLMIDTRNDLRGSSLPPMLNVELIKWNDSESLSVDGHGNLYEVPQSQLELRWAEAGGESPEIVKSANWDVHVLELGR